MPTYVYQAIDPSNGCESCGPGFERIERITADPSTVCPSCGIAIQRVIQPTYFRQVQRVDMSDGRLEKLGFTKVVKDDDGKYKKVFGKDPAADILPQV
jgi:putative FmdB family regulatory protein